MPFVDAYLGLGSRYSYLASTRLESIASETGASITWIPIASPDLFASGRNPFEGAPISGQYDWMYRKADAQAWADYYGVPFREPMGRLQVDARLLTRAALAVEGRRKRIAMMRRLFAAVFVDDRRRVDITTCLECAEQIGIDAKTFRRALDDPMIEAERLALTERARARGVFGVPFFMVGSRGFFGNDRLVLLMHHLQWVDARGGARDTSPAIDNKRGEGT